MADPGFLVGGGRAPISGGGGRGPLMQALFGENVCKNERIGSHRGWHAPRTPPTPRSANGLNIKPNHFIISVIPRIRWKWAIIIVPVFPRLRWKWAITAYNMEDNLTTVSSD